MVFYLYIYFFNTVTLKATVNQCTLRAVRRHRYHPEFKQQLYTVPQYNYYYFKAEILDSEIIFLDTEV